MNTSNRLRRFASLSLIAALTACGGYGEDSAFTPPPIAGISGNGIAVGPISTFGSVVVNGVHYDTSSASISIDGNPASESDLDVGDVVVVRGTIDNDGLSGTADTVFADDLVTGPVDSIDNALGQLVVLGQTVLVNADTSFDNNINPASLAGLNPGDIVEVHGLLTADGSISATRIEGKPGGTEMQVHGLVSGLDAANFRFSINGLIVDYSAAMLDDFPGGEITEGDFVEAKGSSLGAGGELLATKVEFEGDGIIGDEGTHVEIEGFITRYISATDFDVSGMPVTTNGNTQFQGGTSADLGLNVRVEVEGEFDAAGILVADEVEFRRDNDVRVTATIDSVDAGGNSLVMLGITVNADELTRFEDGSDADLRPLTINDLAAGDYVEVRGAESVTGSGEILASLLKRDDLDAKTELRGFVESVSDPSFTILGVTVTTGGGTTFRDADDNIISAIGFFNQVTENSLVDVDGTETGDTAVSADEAELEIE